MFSRYGSVQDVWVAHKPPGFAFVFYKTVREAREAVKSADGRMVCGVRVRVRMGTEVNPSEAHYQGRSFEREYDSPPRERSRGGSSHQSKSYQQQSRGPHHSDRSGRNYEQRSSPQPRSPPPRSGWSGRGSGRSMPRPHSSSAGYAYSSKFSHVEDTYSPVPSHSKYGGHKRSHGLPHYPPNDRHSSREGGSRITRHRSSPDRFPKYSPPAEVMYHGNRRANDRFERHEVQQFNYKDQHQRSRGGGRKEAYPKMPSHQHRMRSRSPHSFSPPPGRQRHDRRHDNKGGWSYSGNHSPPPPSRRSHRDDSHDHRSYRDRVSHDEQFEVHGDFSSDRVDSRGSRKDYVYDDGGRTESRYSNKEHLYKSADREVKYKGRQQSFPDSEHYSRQEEYHEPFVRQERVEYLDNRSDRGSSLEGVDVDDDYDDVIVECDPNDLRRKLLSEGDTRNVREASSSDRG